MLAEQFWRSLPVATVAVDELDRLTDLNPAAETLLNQSAKSIQGRSLLDWAAEPEIVGANLQEARARQSEILLDHVGMNFDGNGVVDAWMQIAPLAELQRSLLVCLRSRAVEERFDRGRRFKSAARSAIGMAEMLSHEIKNPLAGIRGAAQILSMHASGDDLELTELIVDETRRILGLLEQVDQFGSTKFLSVKSLNVHDVLDRACQLGKVGYASSARFETEYDPSLPAIKADEDKLMQVFLNLIKNACEAIETQGGIIRIKTQYDDFLRVETGHGVRLALPVHVDVIDDGPGIGPEMESNIFEPFVSGRANGSGLGLTLVSAILSDMGGWISFETRPGRTAFRVSLPIAGRVQQVS